MLMPKQTKHEIIVFSGDISTDPWVYDLSKHALIEVGALWSRKIDFYKKLLVLEEYTGPEAGQYLEDAKKIFARRAHLKIAAVATLGGPIIGALGIAYAYKKGDKEARAISSEEFACFRARLIDGKQFITVSYRQIFEAMYETHSKWLTDKKAIY